MASSAARSGWRSPNPGRSDTVVIDVIKSGDAVEAPAEEPSEAKLTTRAHEDASVGLSDRDPGSERDLGIRPDPILLLHQ